MGKIIDTITKVTAEGGTVVSFEFFPAKTDAGVDNLLTRIETLVFSCRPHYVSLTWRSAFKDEKLWLQIGTKIQKDFGVDVLLHLTCHLPAADLRRILRAARDAGIRNILALRGDPVMGAERWRPAPGAFEHAIDLVKLIREEHGDYFCVAVAGYPETHTECWNSVALPPSEQARALDLQRLKAKVDAGADFIITQFFYDPLCYTTFLEGARGAGIACPLIPGYMPIQSYEGFSKFVTWCRTRVPLTVQMDLERIKDDDAQVKAYGIELATSTLRAILGSGVTHSVHFYTLNLSSSVSEILKGLHLLPKGPARALPWTSTPSRPEEQVRPIFWANRAAAYLARTADWSEFPNGRFTLSASPAYGELTDYYLSAKRPKVDRRAIWGVPSSVEDVRRVFVSFLDGGVSQLPWCDTPPALETGGIYENLRWMNKCGYLTVNSQPRVNGTRSDDPRYGWGGSDGVVYQKAYIECFVGPEEFERLLGAFSRFPSLTYHAMNMRGEEKSNAPLDKANAVTWGVFPGKEIAQPTVVDPASFRVWKDEAFELWLTQWANVYDDATEADLMARRVIEDIHSTYWLVNIVDNDFVTDEEAIFTLFRDVITEGMKEGELRLRVRDLEDDNRTLREQALKLRDIQAMAETDLHKVLEKLHHMEGENQELRLQLREMQANSIVSRPGTMTDSRSFLLKPLLATATPAGGAGTSHYDSAAAPIRFVPAATAAGRN